MEKIPVQISALQHYLFCKRQCYLIYVENLWYENAYTAKGRDLHTIVDSKSSISRNGTVYARSVRVNSEELGLYGQLDLLEYNKDEDIFIPVEYKKGRPKLNHCDIVQLVAQGLAIRDMLHRKVNYGYIWYYETRHRMKVDFTDELIEETKMIIEEVRSMLINQLCDFSINKLFIKKCKKCSLYKFCQPKYLMMSNRLAKYMDSMINYEEDFE